MFPREGLPTDTRGAHPRYLRARVTDSATAAPAHHGRQSEETCQPC